MSTSFLVFFQLIYQGFVFCSKLHHQNKFFFVSKRSLSYQICIYFSVAFKVTFDVRIMAPLCTDAEQKYGDDRVMEGKEWLYFFAN